MTWLQKSHSNPKASQGGLTSPKLLYQGPDFPNRSRKRWKGRHVRISCINVTYGLSSVVFISHPNQLHICHTSRFGKSQVLQKCFTESVADMSLLQKCQSSVVFMFSRIVAQISRCRNVTSRGKNVTLPKCHCGRFITPDPLRWKMTPPVENDRDPPPMENDPSEGI